MLRLANVTALLLAVGAAPTCACNVPVFRYALEKWPADPYELLVLHQGPLSAEDRALVQSLQRGAAVNLTLAVVALDDRPRDEVQSLLRRFPRAQWPLLVVRYPEVCGLDADVWSGKLTRAVVSALVDSPARRQIVRRLSQGDSAVWVLLESGDKARDDATAELLGAELRRLEKELKLPAATDDPDDKINPDGPPLRVAFSLLRVSRSDPAEAMFVRMLLHSESDLSGRPGPMVFPVYGRGRALYALVGAGINRANVTDAARRIVGPCTCTIKEENPGVDLLVSAPWDDLLTGRLVKYGPLPLASVASLTPPVEEPRAARTSPDRQEPAAPESPLAWNVLLAVFAGLALLAVATFLVLGKRGARA